MGVYTNQTNWFSRRGVFLLLLILFHVILIWGLKSGFAWKVVSAITPPIVAEILIEKKEDKAPPPPPPPDFKPPQVDIPPPVVDIQLTPDAPPVVSITVTDTPRPPTPQVAASVPGTKLDFNKKVTQPSTAEYYPPTSQRLGEEGTAKVKVCVGVNGRVSNSTLVETSGFDRLDEAAIKVSKLYRFNAATENGKPVEACANLPVKFTLKDLGR